MPYPIGLLRDEKEFLENMCQRIPNLRERFNRAVDTYPQERLERIPAWLKTVQRGLWAEMGIADEAAGTLADHVAEMCRLAVLHTKNLKLNEVTDLIFAAAYPKAISGDYFYSHYVSEGEDHRLQDFAARLLYDSERSHPYYNLLSYVLDPDTDEARWVNDLDLLATYIKSRAFEASHPAEIAALQQKIPKLLLTEEGAALFNQLTASQAPRLPSPRP